MKDLFNKNYKTDSPFWLKWRRTFEGGDRYIQWYLKRFSARESMPDFIARRGMTYCPSFAKAIIVDIRNAIFQRMTEVVRSGPKDYIEACLGENGGVDLAGTSMTQYMGSNVLDELLVMSKVAIWIDSGKYDEDGVPTKLTKPRPYVYLYTVEEILNWDEEKNPTSILLKDIEVEYDDDFGLQKKPETVYRHARVVDGKVEVKMLDEKKVQIGPTEYLDFAELPIVILSIKESLMKDICNYQIALMNLASADMNYVLRANFPIYVEQYDLRADMMNKFSKAPEGQDTVVGLYDATNPNYNTAQVATAGAHNIGTTSGIRHPIGTERPGYISPSTEPLLASMQKQEQLQKEMRILVNLSLSNISPNRSSSESKQKDEKGLEAGLAYIGQELERAEKRIVHFWKLYTGSKDSANVEYPNDYSLKPEEVRQSEADKLIEFAKKLPSKTAQRELVKLALFKMFGGRIDSETLTKIRDEVDSAAILYVDPETLFKDLEAHLVSNEYASKLRGYPEEESKKAVQDHADKLSRIAIAQSEASLIKNQDAPGTPTTKTEKEKKDAQDDDASNDAD